MISNKREASIGHRIIHDKDKVNKHTASSKSSESLKKFNSYIEVKTEKCLILKIISCPWCGYVNESYNIKENVNSKYMCHRCSELFEIHYKHYYTPTRFNYRLLPTTVEGCLSIIDALGEIKEDTFIFKKWISLDRNIPIEKEIVKQKELLNCIYIFTASQIILLIATYMAKDSIVPLMCLSFVIIISTISYISIIKRH